MRLTEIDKVEIPSCFRPGDIVKAEVRFAPHSLPYSYQVFRRHTWYWRP